MRGWGAALPWLAAAAAMLLLYVVFAPGHYSFDSAHQWWMVRHDRFDTLHPAAMGLLWQGVRALLPDPHGFFALQLAAVGAGLALVASALALPRWGQALVVLGAVAWPAFGALLPHVWKDVWMVAALLVATGALLHEHQSPHAGWRLLALVALAYATALRFNAITGVIPLLLWLLYAQHRATLRAGGTAPRLRAAAMVPVFLLLAVLPGLSKEARPVPAWPFVALWDLAAVSIATGRPQIPDALLAPEATPAALAGVFRPDTNTTTVGSGLTLYFEEMPLQPAARDALIRSWITLPLREPAAWAAHRWRFATHLFGGADGRDPGLALMPGIVPLRDNPRLSPSAHPLAGPIQTGWHRASLTPLFEGRSYVLVAAGVALLAWRRRSIPALAVSTSVLTMAAPLALIAPAAEFRYLIWPVAGALLALVLLRWPPERYPPRR